MDRDSRNDVLSGMGTTNWDRFLFWTGKYHVTPDFDELERDYKLTVVQRINAAREALLADDPAWVDLMHRAITEKPNNLTNWRQTQPLEAWMNADPDGAALAFRTLWRDDASVKDRFNGFADIVTRANVKAPISETSFFHMAMGVEHYPPFRATAMDRAMDLTRYPLPREAGVASGDIGARYEHCLRFLDIMMKRAAEKGIQFRDRLDAQGAVWIVTQWKPHETWSDFEQQAFTAYRDA